MKRLTKFKLLINVKHIPLGSKVSIPGCKGTFTLTQDTEIPKNKKLIWHTGRWQLKGFLQ